MVSLLTGVYCLKIHYSFIQKLFIEHLHSYYAKGGPSIFSLRRWGDSGGTDMTVHLKGGADLGMKMNGIILGLLTLR